MPSPDAQIKLPEPLELRDMAISGAYALAEFIIERFAKDGLVNIEVEDLRELVKERE